MDEAEVRRLVTALRVALPESAREAEIRVSLLPGMVLIRISADLEAAGEWKTFISTGDAARDPGG